MNDMHSLQQTLERKQSALQGDAKRVNAQREAGKSMARERVERLCDPGSFVELGMLNRDAGVITGYGLVADRPVYVIAQDYTVRGAAMGARQAQKIVFALENARKVGAPVAFLLDSEGAAVDEGALALCAYADVFSAMARMSGVCPLLAAVVGPCAGSAALFTQMSDIAIMDQKHADVRLFGEKVAKKAADQDAGLAALTAANEDEAIALLAQLICLLPSCNLEDAPVYDDVDLNRDMPEASPEDAEALLKGLLDAGDALELYAEYGKAAQTVLGRVGGRTAGVVVTNGQRLTACACEKIARFVRLCDSFNIPILSLLNTSGIDTPENGDQATLVRAAGKTLYAYAEATAPKLAVITGSAIGAAYVAMAGRGIADLCYAWPGAVVSPFTPETAVAVLLKQEVIDGKKPAIEEREALAKTYASEMADGVTAAAQGVLDDVILPSDTRKLLIAGLEMLASKRDSGLPKKHGNQPM